MLERSGMGYVGCGQGRRTRGGHMVRLCMARVHALQSNGWMGLVGGTQESWSAHDVGKPSSHVFPTGVIELLL